MHLKALGLTIVFNGEIYNFQDLRRQLESLGHTFHSETDTEVLLSAYAQWGSDCLSRLNGMFAFAIHDEVRQEVFLARDRIGEKPIYYRAADGVLLFASELKALMANPALSRTADPDALDCYLFMGFVPGDKCILSGFKKLPPAHAMRFDMSSGAVSVWRYWHPPDTVPGGSEESEPRLLAELEILLEQAVERQLIADVPVGVLLSGGIDSSLITAMAARRRRKLRTFSIGFPDGGSLDETKHARLIARHFSTTHVELMADATSAELLPRLARQFDEPMSDSSMFPTWIVSSLVRRECKVALGGDGGDELFGGYPRYRRMRKMQLIASLLPRWCLECCRRSAGHLPVGLRGRDYLAAMPVLRSEGLPAVGILFDAATTARLMRRRERHRIVSEAVHATRCPRRGDIVDRAMRLDLENYLPEDILVKVDRASMANSLEMRAPFLDVHVVEFAMGKVPTGLKVSGSNTKYLLKQLAKRVLPPEFDLRRKQGFSIPLSRWLRAGPFRDLFWETLTDPGCVFDRRTVQGLLEGQDRGRSNAERLFALVQFELWRRSYDVEVDLRVAGA